MASLLESVDLDEDSGEDSGDDFGQEFASEFRPTFSDFEQDAPPGAPVGGAGARASKLLPPAAAPPATAAFKRRVSAELQMYMELIAGAWSLRDEICGSAVSDASKRSCDKLASILCRYPELAQKVIGSGMLADIAGLAFALKPVAQTIIAHHVTHTIGESDDDQPDDDQSYPPYRPH